MKKNNNYNTIIIGEQLDDEQNFGSTKGNK